VDNEDNPVSASDEKQTRMVAPSGNDIALQRTKSWYMSAPFSRMAVPAGNVGTARRDGPGASQALRPLAADVIALIFALLGVAGLF
jgi:hypothetical protein